MSDLIQGEGRIESTLEKVSPKTGKRYGVVKIDGITGTTWDLGLLKSLAVGAYGSYAFKVEGDFKNLASFEVSTSVKAEPGAVPTRDETAMRIARSHALTTGTTIAVATAKPKDTPEALLNQALDIAEKVQVYTVTGKNPMKGPDDPLYKPE